MLHAKSQLHIRGWPNNDFSLLAEGSSSGPWVAHWRADRQVMWSRFVHSVYTCVGSVFFIQSSIAAVYPLWAKKINLNLTKVEQKCKISFQFLSFSRIETPQLGYTGSACMSFYYNMNGAGVGILEVYLMSGEQMTVLWRREGNQGLPWIHQFITLNLNSVTDKVSKKSSRTQCYNDVILLS